MGIATPLMRLHAHGLAKRPQEVCHRFATVLFDSHPFTEKRSPTLCAELLFLERVMGIATPLMRLHAHGLAKRPQEVCHRFATVLFDSHPFTEKRSPTLCAELLFFV